MLITASLEKVISRRSGPYKGNQEPLYHILGFFLTSNHDSRNWYAFVKSDMKTNGYEKNLQIVMITVYYRKSKSFKS